MTKVWNDQWLLQELGWIPNDEEELSANNSTGVVEGIVDRSSQSRRAFGKSTHDNNITESPLYEAKPTGRTAKNSILFAIQDILATRYRSSLNNCCAAKYY